MKDDTSNYNSIFFSKIERIEHISDEGKKLIKELTEEKYTADSDGVASVFV